jgi:hypothetical protein
MAEKHTAARRGPAHEADAAHDILAAEAFVVPASDPALHRKRAHDVLAAEEFVVPAPDPVLHHRGPVVLPADPTGIAQAHDVLAAEAFAMPAPRPRGPAGADPRARPATTPASGPTRTSGPVLAGALGAVAGAVVVLARRGRRRRRRRNRLT